MSRISGPKKSPLRNDTPKRRAERLLAGAEEHAAVDFAGAVEAGDLLLQRTREEHPAESFQVERAAGQQRPLTPGRGERQEQRQEPSPLNLGSADPAGKRSFF